MSKTIIPALAAAALVGASGAWGAPTARSLKEQLIGTWSLVAQYVEQGDKKIERFGPNPKGILIYAASGHVAAILMRPDLPKIASNNALTATAEENKAIVHGSTAFYGTWTVDETSGTLTTRIEGATFPNWDGVAQPRAISFSGDEVKMCVPGAQIGGTACAVWKRIK